MKRTLLAVALVAGLLAQPSIASAFDTAQTPGCDTVTITSTEPLPQHAFTATLDGDTRTLYPGESATWQVVPGTHQIVLAWANGFPGADVRTVTTTDDDCTTSTTTTEAPPSTTSTTMAAPSTTTVAPTPTEPPPTSSEAPATTTLPPTTTAAPSTTVIGPLPSVPPSPPAVPVVAAPDFTG